MQLLRFEPTRDGTIGASLIGRQSAGIQAASVCLFAAGTAIGAQIELPHQPVPYTLQTFFVLLAGALLGKRNGAMSQVLYLAAGGLGLPVFSHWSGGFAHLAGPTGGYLLGFPLAALAVGSIAGRHRGLPALIAGMACGLVVIFALGTLQLGLLYYHDLTAAVVNGFLIFSWWDLLKLAAAATAARGWSGISTRKS